MKILIGYDGSGCSGAALEDLSRAGLPGQVEALVVSVAEKWLPAPPPSAYEVLEHELPQLCSPEPPLEGPDLKQARELAASGSDRVLTLYPTWQVTSEGYAGSPAAEILKRAEEWNPDLIMVGSHGRSGVGRFFLGSVSQKIVTEAHCPVRVARCREGETGAAEKSTPPVILIGFDGSTDSQGTVRAVAHRNWGPGTRAIVVSAHDPVVPTLIGGLIPPVVKMAAAENRAELDWIRNRAATAAETLTRAGLNASSIVLPGDPRSVLTEQAEVAAADCIFVGARGLGALSRFLLGSVSIAIANRARCSVEVVREKDAK